MKRPLNRRGNIYEGLKRPTGPNPVDGILAAMKQKNKNIKNYNGIRNDMQFNEKNSTKVKRYGEMGGSWKLINNDIQFINSGVAVQNVQNGTQLVRLPNMKDDENPWHTHPHPINGRGFWPSSLDLKSILKLPQGKHHLIITIYGTWVLSNGNKNSFTINTNLFQTYYRKFQTFFGGIVSNNGKKLVQQGRSLDLYNSFLKNNNGAINYFMKNELKLIKKDWKSAFGIDIQFFRYKKEIVEYLRL